MPALWRLKTQRKCACFLFSLQKQIAETVPVFIIVSYVKRGWLLISNLWTANIVAIAHAFYFLLLGRPVSKWREINRCLLASKSWADLLILRKSSPKRFLSAERAVRKMSTGSYSSSASYCLCDFGKATDSHCPAASSKMKTKHILLQLLKQMVIIFKYLQTLSLLW